MPNPKARRPQLAKLYWNLRLFGLPGPVRDGWMLVLTVLLIVALVAQGKQAVRAQRDAQQNTRSLCAFRHDLQDRVAQSDKFLHDHPDGFAGIPAATLRVSEQGQIRTIQVLSNLKCGPRR